MSNIKLILLTISLILISSVLLFAAESEPTPVKNDNKLDDRDILAEFQGGQVLRKDLQFKISKLPPNMQGRYQTIDGQLQVLDIITTEEVFYRKAIDLGIDKSPDVRDKILQVQKRYYLQEYYKRNVSDLVTLTEDDKQSFIRKI